jgi:hypothetical protein
MTSVQVTVAGGRTCPQCGSALCLSAQIGQHRRTVALCPACDAENPDARQLLAYFAGRPTVDPTDRGQVAELLGRWLNSLPATDPSPSLAEAAEAWWAQRHPACPAANGRTAGELQASVSDA